MVTLDTSNTHQGTRTTYRDTHVDTLDTSNTSHWYYPTRTRNASIKPTHGENSQRGSTTRTRQRPSGVTHHPRRHYPHTDTNTRSHPDSTQSTTRGRIPHHTRGCVGRDHCPRGHVLYTPTTTDKALDVRTVHTTPRRTHVLTDTGTQARVDTVHLSSHHMLQSRLT